ncbi:MAG: cytochrome b/b6 domain-containing protein [Rhizobiaceae bacterium]
MSTISSTDATDIEVPVWDFGVRLFHWLFALGITAELVLGFLAPPALLPYHVWIGYSILGLVAFRFVWGLAGPGFARFSTFPPSIAATLHHLAGKGRPTLGHNPLGGWMVYAFLTLATLMAATGIAALGGLEREGPAAAIAVSTGESARLVHTAAAWAFVILIPAHIAGVLFESWRESQNLARSMVTGTKHVNGAAETRKPARLLLAASLAIALSTSGGVAYVALANLPQPQIPATLVNEAWAVECGACHSPHHPVLLPGATWARIMATLDGHFGEDASLPGKTAKEIGDWLTANSSEHFDTKTALWFQAADTAEPLRITATAKWKSIHEDIPADTFKRKKIASAANCNACHADSASGRFALTNISIPAP